MHELQELVEALFERNWKRDCIGRRLMQPYVVESTGAVYVHAGVMERHERKALIERLMDGRDFISLP